MLATDVWESTKPTSAARWKGGCGAGMAFAVGGDWLGESNLTRDTEHSDLPAWLIVTWRWPCV